ncbi:MAG: NAD-dependent epimerase/dehydratase family protein [Mucilaginibacter sp.]
MINVLITGSSGFVGQNLLRFLSNKQFKVHTLTRSQSVYDDKSVKEITWENLNLEKLNSIDVIIHLAGKAHDTKNTSSANEYFEINTELTKRIFDLFLNSNTSTFIYMSSVKAATDVANEILTEDIKPSPKTPYGQSKLKAEEYISSFAMPAGKRAIILRPCMIHGPGNKGNLNLLYRFVQKNIPYPLAAYENQRSFLSIDNLNFIIEQLMLDQSILGGIYNLADDLPLSTNSVINMIAEVNRTMPRLWKINRGIINFLAKIGDKLHLPLNSETLKKLTESYVVSNEKIKKALSITCLPLSSEDGLKLTIKSFHSS